MTKVVYEQKGSSTMTNDNIKYEYLQTGWPNNEVDRIYRYVKKFVRKQFVRKREFKIGMTACPERRLKENFDELANWRKMYVLYTTTSNSNQKQVERELIHILNKKYPKKIENGREGGAGRPANPPLYVYVVVK